jgi:DNA-binding winged helix-turn-helix (wHTH) protein
MLPVFGVRLGPLERQPAVKKSPQNVQVIRFATFEVDLRSGELRKGGVKLKLSGQPFQVLAILLERPGDVVTREELQERLWPDTFVDVDHNLNTAINKIRDVLGDGAENPRFVETLTRRGYRFIAPVEGTGNVARPGEIINTVTVLPERRSSAPGVAVLVCTLVS